jgi:hypothetical protein
MMGDKPTILVIYGSVGLCLAAGLPVFGRARLVGSAPLAASTSTKEPAWIAGVIGALAILFLMKMHPLLPPRYVAYGGILSGLAAALAQNGYRMRTAAGMFMSILVASVIPWWLRSEDQHLTINGLQSVLMLLGTSLGYWSLTRTSQSSANVPIQKRLRALIYVAFVIGAGYLVLSTGLALTTANTTPWHHWGAYIGPAQLVSAGALPLHDIPVQYGLGPTLLLAQGCKTNCWMSLYWMAGISTIGMTGLLGCLAVWFNGSRHPLAVAATLFIVLLCCLFWTAYPPALMASLATPSTSGIRFLPGVLVLTWLTYQIRRNKPIASYAIWGHVLWLACIVWSPEAGAHATMLWAPYFVWMRTLTAEAGTRGTFARFFGSIITLALVLATGVTLLAGIYRMALGDWPLPAEYAAYVLHPPGPMPINPRGTIWFSLACMICWCAAWTLSPRAAMRDDHARASWLVALLCLATFTYYLGRSHDNNILNLLPYLALLLFATRAITPVGALRTLATTLLAALIGWSTAFGYVNYQEASKQGLLLAFTPQELVDSFSRETERGLFYMAPQAREAHLHPEDAIPALKYIRGTFHESVEIFDLFMLVDGAEVYPPWSALHGPENYVYIPSESRCTYLERVARRLHKPGWVLYQKSEDVSAYLAEYDSVYNRNKELDFGTYTAIRYVPR